MADDILKLIQEMQASGNEQTLPQTGRKIRLRTLDVEALLYEGKVPDILTPLVIKSVYQDLDDDTLLDFMRGKEVNPTDAIKHLQAIDYVVQKCITDGTDIKKLTLGERRWIFRLVMMPAEILVTFRYEQESDVESVPEGDEVRSVTEPDNSDAYGVSEPSQEYGSHLVREDALPVN